MALTRVNNQALLGAPGAVLQVQYSQYTGTFYQTLTANTDTAVANFSVNITPLSTSSKILLQGHVFWEGGLTDHEFIWMFMRGSTALKAPQAGSNRRSGVSIGSTAYYADDKASTPSTAIYQYFDAPITTSQLTYHIGVSSRTGATIYINRSIDDTDSIDHERGISYISAIEIAG